MNINETKTIMIFKNVKEDKIFYNMGLSKKNEDGTYTNGSIPVQFKKGIELENMEKITIKTAWLTFYKKEKLTVPYIFISEFVRENEQTDTQEEAQEEVDELPF